MSFDFAAAEKQAVAEYKTKSENRKLGLLLLGQSGGGKSTAIGTLGVKTLYLYTSGESHGPDAARTFGSDNVVPVCVDYAAGKRLTADQAYERLLQVVGDSAGVAKAGFGAVVLDGLTELEALVRGTKKWENGCLAEKSGKHNSFAEGGETLKLIRPVMDGLRDLQHEAGVHYIVTGILTITEVSDDGSVLNSQPRLTTYGVADSLIPQFPDIVVVGRMIKDDKPVHALQFLANVTKESKDAKGVIKKTVSYAPRLTGVPADKLPASAKADLAKLATFKKENAK